MRKPGPRKRKARALQGAVPRLYARFIAAFPPRGPCMLCGVDAWHGGDDGTPTIDWLDARHRLVDAIRARARAGDSAELLARDYALPLPSIRLALETSFR